MKNGKKEVKINLMKKIFNKKITSLKSITSNKKNINNSNDILQKQKGINKTLKQNINENSKDNTYSIIKVKNANEYWHLLNGKKNQIKSQVNWSINLRDYEINKKILLKNQNLNPPSFYEEDEEKYKKKNLKKTNSFRETLCYNNYKHLLSTKISGETLSKDTLEFETTLRDFKLKKDVSINHKEKWNNITSCSFFNATSYLPQNDKLNEKYIIRPYKILRKSVSCGNVEIKQKNYIKDEIMANNWFGAHKSDPPYKDIYQNKNYYELENVLNGKDKNRLQCLFLLGLRNQFEKNNRKKG